ncbi:MAG: GNAT family N-acetyltransferase [Candidatus Saccharimonadales bacterium]
MIVKETTPMGFTVSPMTPEDTEVVTDIRLQSWLDTYVNEAAGVSREWVEARNAEQRTPAKAQARKERLEDHNVTGWVARSDSGIVIGAVTPYREADGTQHLGSLYVTTEWHGKSVGAALMQKVLAWADPKSPLVLGVVSYNERAKAFYRKWGFEEVPGSEAIFENTMPEVKMIWKGTKQ